MSEYKFIARSVNEHRLRNGTLIEVRTLYNVSYYMRNHGSTIYTIALIAERGIVFRGRLGNKDLVAIFGEETIFEETLRGNIIEDD